MSVETHAVLQTRAEEAPVLEESARTTTKKEMVERIAASTNQSRTDVKRTIQAFLDEVIEELGLVETAKTSMRPSSQSSWTRSGANGVRASSSTFVSAVALVSGSGRRRASSV